MIISIIISSSKQADSKVVFDYYGIIYNKTNVKMEMPKNSKNQGSNKFIIKAKPTLAHLRSENVDP